MGVQEKIDTLTKVLKKEGATRIILFGSRAKEYATKYSDIDIAVDLSLDYRAKRKLKEKIDLKSGLYSVDLVFLPDVGPDFAKQIEKEGRVLYEKK